MSFKQLLLDMETAYCFSNDKSLFDTAIEKFSKWLGKVIVLSDIYKVNGFNASYQSSFLSKLDILQALYSSCKRDVESNVNFGKELINLQFLVEKADNLILFKLFELINDIESRVVVQSLNNDNFLLDDFLNLVKSIKDSFGRSTETEIFTLIDKLEFKIKGTIKEDFNIVSSFLDLKRILTFFKCL